MHKMKTMGLCINVAILCILVVMTSIATSEASRVIPPIRPGGVKLALFPFLPGGGGLGGIIPPIFPGGLTGVLPPILP